MRDFILITTVHRFLGTGNFVTIYSNDHMKLTSPIKEVLRLFLKNINLITRLSKLLSIQYRMHPQITWDARSTLGEPLSNNFTRIVEPLRPNNLSLVYGEQNW